METDLKQILKQQEGLKTSLERLEKEWHTATEHYFREKKVVEKKLSDLNVEKTIIMRTMARKKGEQ